MTGRRPRTRLGRYLDDAIDNPWGAVRMATVLLIIGVAAMAVLGVPPNRAPAAYWLLIGMSTTIILGVLAWLVFWWPSTANRRNGMVAAALLIVSGGLNWTAAIVGDAKTVAAFNPLISTTVLALVLMVYRGAVVQAWLVVGAIVTMGICVGVGVGAGAGLEGWAEAAFPVAMGATFFAISGAAVVLRGMRSEITQLMDRRMELGAQTRRTQQARERREQRIDRLAEQVRPVLTKVADGQPLTEADLQEARLLELGLRDGIRGAALDVPEISEAAHSARIRGVTVTLLDDGGLETVPGRTRAMVLDSVVPLVVSELRSLGDGELVVRVMPPGRDIAATVTTQSGDVRLRRVQVGWNGLTAALN